MDVTLNCIALNVACIVLHCIALHCIAFHCINECKIETEFGPQNATIQYDSV